MREFNGTDYDNLYPETLNSNLINGSATGSVKGVGVNSTYTPGQYSFCEGLNTQASGTDSHAEGNGTTASGYAAHAEGGSSTASNSFSHAEGSHTIASGNKSHAEGFMTIASGTDSHAEGNGTTASGLLSHTEGNNTTSESYCLHSQGLYNKVNSGSATVYSATQNAFVIGNGTEDTLSNAFRIIFDGNMYGGTYHSSGADYAEYFEWADGNLNDEDRIGHFVALQDGKIHLAATGEDVIGVISGNGSVIGDSYDDQWQGQWMRDTYGRLLYEDVLVTREVPEVLDENGNPKTETVIEHRMKLNPDYDATKPYVPRSKRKEWDAVGMLGKLVVIDDGSCTIGGKCDCVSGGIATNGTKYRVIQRLDNTHIMILASFL